jgi:hypothetical protein
MTLGYRLRAWSACVSILFNQTLHVGNAPYPYTLSETCWLRRHRLRYAIGRAIIDSVFSLIGEEGHCELSYYVGQSFRAKEQL